MSFKLNTFILVFKKKKVFSLYQSVVSATAYHHGPGDGGEPLMDTEQDEEKEDDGEEP